VSNSPDARASHELSPRNVSGTGRRDFAVQDGQERDHVAHPTLPWRTDRPTQCGRAADAVASVISVDELEARIQRNGHEANRGDHLQDVLGYESGRSSMGDHRRTPGELDAYLAALEPYRHYRASPKGKALSPVKVSPTAQRRFIQMGGSYQARCV
jgi:hypothetical protein